MIHSSNLKSNFANVKSRADLFTWMKSHESKHLLALPISKYCYISTYYLRENSWLQALENSAVLNFYAKFCYLKKSRPKYFPIPSNHRESTPAMDRIFKWMKIRGAKEVGDTITYPVIERVNSSIFASEIVETPESTLLGNIQFLNQILGALFNVKYFGESMFTDAGDGRSLEQMVMDQPECHSVQDVMEFCEKQNRNKRDGETHSTAIRSFLYFYNTGHLFYIMRNVLN